MAKQYGIREHELAPHGAEFVPFTAQTRMSGVDYNGTRLRKGAGDAILRWVADEGGQAPPELQPAVDRLARQGSTPLAVARDSQVLGVIELRDVIKDGMRERFEQLRTMGIRTVMVTGDNRLTAAKIAEESGVDDFLSEATPEAKLELIRSQQADGRLVAMTGDGTNDAPALAQADVGVAMNTGTQAAREAGNMVDLDSNPTKLIEIVEVGKQLLITRGALTTFSIANDVAKYFAILPAMFAAAYATKGAAGPLDQLNIMALGSPRSAIISAIIFNALVIPALVPLALRGVRYRPVGATALLRRNLLIYGLGGVDRAVHRHQADRPRGPQSPRCLMPTRSAAATRSSSAWPRASARRTGCCRRARRRPRPGRDVVVGLVETTAAPRRRRSSRASRSSPPPRRRTAARRSRRWTCPRSSSARRSSC